LVGWFIHSFIHPLRKTGKKTVEEKLQITIACFVMMMMIIIDMFSVAQRLQTSHKKTPLATAAAL
jgi:hypothetical protein